MAPNYNAKQKVVYLCGKRIRLRHKSKIRAVSIEIQGMHFYQLKSYIIMKQKLQSPAKCQPDPDQEMIKNTEENIIRYKQKIIKRPNTYLPKLAESYYYLASLYWEKSEEYDKIEKLLLKSLEYYENYSGRKQNIPLDKISVLGKLLELYNRTNRLECSEQMLFRMLEIYKMLAQTNWLIFSEDVSVMEWRLGNLYFDMKRPVQAEQMYLAALKTRAEFDREDIYRYRSGTAQFQRSLGELYESHLHDYSKAEKCYLKSVEILQELCENIYERCNYIRPLIYSFHLLADLYKNKGEQAKADQCNAKAEILKKELE